MAINVLAGIASSPSANDGARVTACGLLLDRGWGRTQVEHGDNSGSSIRVTIRQIIQAADAPGSPLSGPGKVIEHDHAEQPLNYGGDELD